MTECVHAGWYSFYIKICIKKTNYLVEMASVHFFVMIVRSQMKELQYVYILLK